MAADFYDDKKNLKLFIQIFNFFDCYNQTDYKQDILIL